MLTKEQWKYVRWLSMQPEDVIDRELEILRARLQQKLEAFRSDMEQFGATEEERAEFAEIEAMVAPLYQAEEEEPAPLDPEVWGDLADLL